jgi:hypothetical protein
MLIKSFDGGLTFSDTIRVSADNPNHKYRMGNIVINSDGNPVVSYMQYLLNWMEPQQMVNTSNNYGSSFNGAIEGSALAPGEPCDCCKSSLVSSGDDLFLLFRNNHNNERNSFISKSTDGGLSFIATTDLDDYDWILNSCPATTPRGVIIGDSVIIIKRSGATGNNEIVCSSVNTIDLNYSYNNNVDLIVGVQQDYPEIAANKDTIVAVWQDNRSGMQDCYISVSTDGASSLYGSISFTDSTTGGYKSDPDVAYVKGNIHLVYLDNTQHKILYVRAFFDVLNEVLNVSKNSSQVSKIIDILGRETIPTNYTPLFYIYEDGSVERKIITN